MNRNNLFTYLPDAKAAEIIETVLTDETIRIERIVSAGQSSAPDFWYNQDMDEWVVLLQGKAEVEFMDGRLIRLEKGDYIHIPAGEKHRVKKTSRRPVCIWLAIHYSSKGFR
jgi:cupin 2 domain-containing protein